VPRPDEQINSAAGYFGIHGSLAGLVATDESLAQSRRSKIKALAFDAARAGARAGNRPLGFEARREQIMRIPNLFGLLEQERAARAECQRQDLRPPIEQPATKLLLELQDWRLAEESKTKGRFLRRLYEAIEQIQIRKHTPKRDRIKQMLLAHPEYSERRVAKTLGVSRNTVASVKREIEEDKLNISIETVAAQNEEILVRLRELRETQTEIMGAVSETVERLRSRFPNDAEVSAAVDDFLAEI
jgi:DNA-binding CsgD family transcriptional regulator